MDLIRLSSKKFLKLTVGLLLSITLTYISIYGYVNIYQPPLKFPDDKAWTENLAVVDARSFLAKRWNTDLDKISILSVWENGQGTIINLLDTQSLSGAIMFLPIGSPSFKTQQHPLYKEIEAKAMGSVYTKKGMLYLTDEYIPLSPKEKLIVSNYYAGKYPWLGSPTYRVIIKANPKYGWFQVGSTNYPVYFGLPIDLFPILLT